MSDKIHKVSTPVFEIWVDEHGILRVDTKPGARIDMPQVKEAFEIYRKLGFGPGKKKALEIMTGIGISTMSREGRDYAATLSKDYFVAAAIVSDSAMIRFLVNFFNNFYVPEVPFKMFADKYSAIAWLKSFRREETALLS
ncbi:MAG TPA: STAS/SEC14 domain-containing protein [Bacteroidia bacterium]|nr:STAS/SEC14 domain-containing protein [Bacteroidia bacterium]